MAPAKVAKAELHLDPLALRTEIADITKSAYAHADALGHLAESTRCTLDDLFRDATADELTAKATHFQSSVLHGLCVIAALAALAGRLQGAAWLRQTIAGNEVKD